MRNKLISIIIPTYNCGPKFAATMESLKSQPSELFEVIVVDGGSTADTLSVIKDFGGDSKVVSESDRGVYDALNKGIRMATGKYLICVGAGDRLREDVLAQVAAILPEEKMAFVYGNAYLVRHGLVYAGEFTRKTFMEKNICQQAIFYERTLFDVFGTFDLRYKVYADHAFNMRCFADSRVRKIYLDMVVADFEGWGISDTQVDHRFNTDLPRLIRKYVGMQEYLRYRIYRSRVSFYDFRHRLATSARTSLTWPAPVLGRKERYDAEEDVN